MSLCDRKTLKAYFADGSLPTEQHFAQLIDSTLNMHDEGFLKTPLDGLKINSAVGAHSLITFYRTEQRQQGLWRVAFGGGSGDTLTLQPAAQGAALALDQAGRVAIGHVEPQHRLDVAGTVGARARVGTLPVPERAAVKADHRWHDITGDLSGCMALEVVASVGLAKTGRHAVMHAMALNAHQPGMGGVLGWLGERFPWIDRLFNRRRRIRCQNAWFGDNCDRLQLQWVSSGPESYRLQLRTRCEYPGAPQIQVHITQLWPIGVDGDPPAEPRP